MLERQAVRDSKQNMDSQPLQEKHRDWFTRQYYSRNVATYKIKREIFKLCNYSLESFNLRYLNSLFKYKKRNLNVTIWRLINRRRRVQHTSSRNIKKTTNTVQFPKIKPSNYFYFFMNLVMERASHSLMLEDYIVNLFRCNILHYNYIICHNTYSKIKQLFILKLLFGADTVKWSSFAPKRTIFMQNLLIVF